MNGLPAEPLHLLQRCFGLEAAPHRKENRTSREAGDTQQHTSNQANAVSVAAAAAYLLLSLSQVTEECKVVSGTKRIPFDALLRCVSC